MHDWHARVGVLSKDKVVGQPRQNSQKILQQCRCAGGANAVPQKKVGIDVDQPRARFLCMKCEKANAKHPHQHDAQTWCRLQSLHSWLLETCIEPLSAHITTGKRGMEEGGAAAQAGNNSEGESCNV